MKIYITRHGQVDLKAEYYNGDVSLPKGEVPLSELGRQQAVLLGKRMKELGFRGKIFASPLLRTMETAELVAKETGSTIIPTSWFHEIFIKQDEIDVYKGYSVRELSTLFPHVKADAFMEEIWWATKAETQDAVYKRVSEGLAKFMEKETEDVLFVGHAASATAALEYFHLKEKGILWNCGLSLYETEETENNFYNDISHLPGHMVSCNKLMGADVNFDAAYSHNLYPIEIPEKLREEKAVKLLHIGDTHSATYLYYKKLIRLVKPDIIVHTGDSADEVKVGRMPGTEEEYLDKVQELLDILEGANCKVYWIPGNNDLPEEIAKRAPFIEIVQPNTVLNIEGVDICVSHMKKHLTKQADVCLYGHGRRAETAELEKRMPGSDTLYLNVMWNSYVLTLPQIELYEFERPEYRQGIWECKK